MDMIQPQYNSLPPQMPPIARSVPHDEAVALLDHWIDTIVDARYEGAGCE
jgi:hypothetical protein